jgi:translation initiation factor IF-2
MAIAICPYCLHPVACFDKDYTKGEVKAVKVDVENAKCSVLLASNVYKNAKCSNIQGLKVAGGKIAKELQLTDEQKEQFFNTIIKLKREHNRWKDYKILEIALNTVLGD